MPSVDRNNKGGLHRALRRSIAVLAVAFAMTGCEPQAAKPTDVAVSPEATAPAVATPPTATDGGPSKMSQIIDMSNIGRRVDIFERVAGAPTDASADYSSYQVEGCAIGVQTKDNMVRMITIQLTPDLSASCKADLAPLFGASTPMPADKPITFAAFEAAAGTGAEYKAPCIGMNCGNAFEPFFEAVITGVHANGFNDVIAMAMLSGDASDAVDAWEKALAKVATEDYLMEAKFNCERTHDALARKMLGGSTVESISFGQRDDPYSCT